ncbi:hypothetical protein SAMN05444365_107133 [Micromonospora pattaloongensis]|uniref:Uncharacterized protein n=1 Tax=Micromonospora pattaloongensis TaxID=405436 RepID=A0A1H3R7Z4_9ACTN|nr:hypothetical protein [Micromonospora pattaloongensis]SDZ21904.1 hypothetical protein SAMN05444365_107133 [Micromonospora pattaloongensis]
MNVLGTVATHTTWAEHTGWVGNRKVVHEVPFEDWIVDGVPLRELVTADRQPPNPAQEMTPLCELGTWPETAVESLRRLLGDEPGDFDDGRVPLLFCPIDADLGCQTLSTTLVLDDETVEWRDLGWQVSYEPFVAANDGFDPPMHFHFDRKAYTELLRALLGRFEEVVAAHAAAQQAPRRRFWRR